MQSWHGDDEAEEVVDDGVQEPVEQSTARHVLNALEAIVDVQLRSHVDEAKGVDATHKSVEDESVKALVLFVEERIDSITANDWERCPGHVGHGDVVIFFGWTLFVGLGVLYHPVWKGFDPCHFGGLGNFPAFKDKSET